MSAQPVRYAGLAIGLLGIAMAALSAFLLGFTNQFLVRNDSPLFLDHWLIQDPIIRLVSMLVLTSIVVIGNLMGGLVAALAFQWRNILRWKFVWFVALGVCVLLLCIATAWLPTAGLEMLAAMFFGMASLIMFDIFAVFAKACHSPKLEHGMRCSQMVFGTLMMAYPVVVASSLFVPEIADHTWIFYAGWIAKLAFFGLQLATTIIAGCYAVFFLRGNRFQMHYYYELAI